MYAMTSRNSVLCTAYYYLICVNKNTVRISFIHYIDEFRPNEFYCYINIY